MAPRCAPQPQALCWTMLSREAGIVTRAGRKAPAARPLHRCVPVPTGIVAAAGSPAWPTSKSPWELFALSTTVPIRKCCWGAGRGGGPTGTRPGALGPGFLSYAARKNSRPGRTAHGKRKCIKEKTRWRARCGELGGWSRAVCASLLLGAGRGDVGLAMQVMS